ncbi:MAG: MBL fold metallo-hydrolase [Chloroflexi bacterium]|nr:MBL fold metallo-hydrolase [Chloroflexota bacterium]
MKLSFLGAAQNVTGSRYLLEADGFRLLVDCGMYQERDLKVRNWDPFPVPPRSIDAVLLTHAHLDHCGFLPRFVRDGFRGRIYCTPATADIVEIMLKDSAHIQQEDVEQKRKRHEREGRKSPHPYVPLYTIEDVQDTLPLVTSVSYKSPVALGKGVQATYYEAGHVLGAAMIKVEIARNGDRTAVLFSGDVGRWNVPILRDPTVFEGADYVLVESTYGDRVHSGSEIIGQQLADVIRHTTATGGNVIVPSFALERSQEVLYHLNLLLMQGRIPRTKVFLDSPMAVSVTRVFEQHPELFDRDMVGLVEGGNSPFRLPGLTMVRTVEDSRSIDGVNGPTMIIAGSGMCTGGRIKYHLANNISKGESTILFVGYQAVGTLGREIVDGSKQVRIHGQMYPVKAKIVQISGFSAHADRQGLLKWLSGIRRPPKQVFVVHGESGAARSFATFIKDELRWDVSVPSYLEEAQLA